MNNAPMPKTIHHDTKPTCQVVVAGPEFIPGGQAKAHKHEDHETAIYILSGESGMWYGESLEEHLTARAKDFVYIPADMPHLPYNLSKTDSVVTVIARTDPNEQESVLLLPALDRIRTSKNKEEE